LVSIGPDKQVPAVGGKPKPDFTGLEARDPDLAVIAARHHPKDTAASTKAYDERIKGLTPSFSAGGNLKDFMESVDKHLVKHGLDTIAYIPDPSD
jgi:ABC-type enterochelin transport system substrate-binding protein